MNLEKKRINQVTVVGTLSEIERIEGVSAKGVAFLRGKAIISSGNDKYQVEYYSPKTWGSGKENAQYDVIKGLSLDTLVKVTGNLEGNRFHTSDDSLIVTNRIRVGFFNEPYESDVAGATFDFLGFITQELTETRDKEQNLKGYTFKIAQSRYNADTGLDVVTLNVAPENAAAVNYMRDNYKLGTTVRPSGRIKSTIEITEVREKAVFGEDNVKTYQKNVTEFVVDNSLHVDELEKYTQEEINTLVANTEANDAKTLADRKAKSKPAAAAGFSAAPKTTGTDSAAAGNLLGI